MDKRNINTLKKWIDLKPLTHAFEIFFLYDLENTINETYVTQLNKELSIYGLITFSSENKHNKELDLVTPDNNIKFQLKRDIYKNSIGFELAKVHEKKSYTVINNKILNMGLLRSDKNRFVGQKYKMNEKNWYSQSTWVTSWIRELSKSNQYFIEFKQTFEKIGKIYKKISIDLYWKISYLDQILQTNFFFQILQFKQCKRSFN